MSNWWTPFHSQFGCLLDEYGRYIVDSLGCRRCTRQKLICSENSFTKLNDTKCCSFSCQNMNSFEIIFKCNVVISMLFIRRAFNVHSIKLLTIATINPQNEVSERQKNCSGKIAIEIVDLFLKKCKIELSSIYVALQLIRIRFIDCARYLTFLCFLQY